MDSQRTRIVGSLEALARGADLERLIADGARLRAEGADIVEVDAVSGSWPETPDREELGRLVHGLVAEGASVAVTTTSADIAVVAADQGAEYIIDPSGGVADPFLPRIIAAGGLRYVVGQWAVRHPLGHVTPSTQGDFIEAVSRRIEALLDAGVASEQLVLDSGAGLVLGGDEEWRMIDHLGELAALGHPILVNASRPPLLASLLPDEATDDEREAAALAVCVLAVEAGAWAVGVHNVARTAHALRGLLRYSAETDWA